MLLYLSSHTDRRNRTIGNWNASELQLPAEKRKLYNAVKVHAICSFRPVICLIFQILWPQNTASKDVAPSIQPNRHLKLTRRWCRGRSGLSIKHTKHVPRAAGPKGAPRNGESKNRMKICKKKIIGTVQSLESFNSLFKAHLIRSSYNVSCWTA